MKARKKAAQHEENSKKKTQNTVPSKLNDVDDVPTNPATVTPSDPAEPAPAVPMHTTVLDVTHDVVLHSPSETSAVAVTSVVPKFAPASVTLTMLDARLYGVASTITGAVSIRRAVGFRCRITRARRTVPDTEVVPGSKASGAQTGTGRGTVEAEHCARRARDTGHRQTDGAADASTASADAQR